MCFLSVFFFVNMDSWKISRRAKRDPNKLQLKILDGNVNLSVPTESAPEQYVESSKAKRMIFTQKS